MNYLDLASLNQVKISKQSLGVIHLNISSIANHINDLRYLLSLSKHKFHIICISESRIHKGVDPSVNINIPGYTFEHTPTDSKAGGTLIYISNDIDYKIRNDLKIYIPPTCPVFSCMSCIFKKCPVLSCFSMVCPVCPLFWLFSSNQISESVIFQNC